MSDSEEDYMSDKLLEGAAKQDIRPGLLFNHTQKRALEQYKKKQEAFRKKPKTYQEQEKETRERGLNTPITSENKGFKLLEKMGYKSGTSLGKNASGIKEPINIIVKNNLSGVGRAQHAKEVLKNKTDMKEKVLKLTEEEFRSNNAMKRINTSIQKDYYKAQRTCENLDFKNDVASPIIPYFWTKATRIALIKPKKVTDESDSSEDDEEEEEIEEITEETLHTIISYLRKTYNYCIYCGDFVEQNEEDTSLSCPGYFRVDHDDII